MSRSSFSFTLRAIPLVVAMYAGALPVHAQSLVDLYTAARGFDATYQSAKSQFDANLAKADQAQALLLPTVGLTASFTQNNQDVQQPSASAKNYSYGSQVVTLAATQPLYRPANAASYEQGKKQVDLAQAQLKQAEQDLIVKVSQTYFDVLASADNLAFVKSQKTAVSEQLASAKRNFEVGTSTITDSREAQARYDLVIAQELAADNDLLVKTLALNQLTGLVNAVPTPLNTPVLLNGVEPNSVELWVGNSEANHPTIHQLIVALDLAKLETAKAQAGHKPTLDLTASYSNSGSQNNLLATTPKVIYGDTMANVAAIGLSFNLPLFAGFSTQNRIKETLALEDKARTDLEATKRTVAQGTRTAFYGVQSGLGQVKALEAAEASSQSALDANKLGYQVGVRINIDVLNSQSQLFDTKAKLAKARYDVLLGGLKLRQAAGTLTADDLQPVNAQLAK
jgi:outer membrane protein